MGDEEKRGANWTAVEGEEYLSTADLFGSLRSNLDLRARSLAGYDLAGGRISSPVTIPTRPLRPA